MLKKTASLLCFALGVTLAASADEKVIDGASEWGAYGRDPGGMRFAPDASINRANVASLKPAWTFRTGELRLYEGNSAGKQAAFEATPLMVAGTLYFSTPSDRVFALDPGSGILKWQYDPHIDMKQHFSEITSRGVALWIDKVAADGRRNRVFIGTIDGRLICLDAATGTPCKDFGTDGAINLREGVDDSESGGYLVTSPPALIGDLVVVGSAIDDNRTLTPSSA